MPLPFCLHLRAHARTRMAVLLFHAKPVFRQSFLYILCLEEGDRRLFFRYARPDQDQDYPTKQDILAYYIIIIIGQVRYCY